jgi:hypothetical protein
MASPIYTQDTFFFDNNGGSMCHVPETRAATSLVVYEFGSARRTLADDSRK